MIGGTDLRDRAVRARVVARVRRSLRTSNLLSIGLVLGVLVGLLAYFEGLAPRNLAMLAMLAPPLVAVVLLRPAWIVLAIVLVPPGLLRPVPNAVLALLAALPLVGLFVRSGHADVSWRSGMYPMAGVVALAHLNPAASGGTGASYAAGLLTIVTFYVLLGFSTYELVRRGALSLDRLVDAVVIGAVVLAMLELALSGSPGHGPATALTYGRLIGNITVFGLVAVVVRIVSPGPPRRLLERPALNVVLLLPLALVTGLTLLRAAWLAALLAVAIVLWRLGRIAWLGVVPLCVLLIFAVPPARDRVFPGMPEEGLDLTEYTTGRWRLWERAIDEVDPSSPLGRGWGHWWSLSPEDVFGSNVTFITDDDQEFVFPHNDGLLLLIELGLPALVLYLAFWVHLVRAEGRLIRGPPDVARPALMLLGVLVMFGVTELVENGLQLRALGERFFIVAGAVHGASARLARDQEAAGGRVAGLPEAPAARSSAMASRA